MTGFTLAYGAMFSKVWIVHRMGAKENQQVVKEKDEVSITQITVIFEFTITFSVL